MNYYNEIDPVACEWLRELIERGQISPGVVDNRSIEDVVPAELFQFDQCHFFAGIGVWSYALRQAGWPDDRPVWTASLPCQPFSVAGQGKGFADERHLWPSFLWLVRQRRPDVIVGEQVGRKAGETWLDLVSNDLEAEGYAVGSNSAASCGFGAPMQRPRVYWVAESNSQRPQGFGLLPGEGGGKDTEVAGGCKVGKLAAATGERWQVRNGQQGTQPSEQQRPERLCSTGDLAVSSGKGLEGNSTAAQAGKLSTIERGSNHCGVANSSGVRCEGKCGSGTTEEIRACERSTADWPDATNGYWRDPDWLFCRDDKWRPVEPGTFPLVDGAAANVGRMQSRLEGLGIDPADIRRLLRRRDSTLAVAGRNRVARLKGYGNAINAEHARAFIEAYMEVVSDYL